MPTRLNNVARTKHADVHDVVNILRCCSVFLLVCATKLVPGTVEIDRNADVCLLFVMALLSILAVAGLASASGYSEGNIYPAGHFKFSTGLTTETFERVALRRPHGGAWSACRLAGQTPHSLPRPAATYAHRPWVQEQVDSGKTAFVRWIASEG